jgi:hypothetical protein
MSRFLLALRVRANFARNTRFPLVKPLFREMKSDVLKAMISESSVSRVYCQNSRGPTRCLIVELRIYRAALGFDPFDVLHTGETSGSDSSARRFRCVIDVGVMSTDCGGVVHY